MSNVFVHLDYQQFHQRPTDTDLAIITMRMGEPVEISIEKLSEELTFPNGKTFYPACYSGIRSIVNWQSQQVFVLDFDETLSLENFLNRCEDSRVGESILPAFIYSTFSSVDNNRYRAVWVLEKKVKNYRNRSAMEILLYTLFPEADIKCKNGGHPFYGGKEIIFENFQAILDPNHFMDAVCLYLQMTTKNGNAARVIRGMAKKMGMKVSFGLPVQEIEKFEIAVSKDVNTPSPSIIKETNSPFTSRKNILISSKLNSLIGNYSIDQRTRAFKFVDSYTDDMARKGILPNSTRKSTPLNLEHNGSTESFEIVHPENPNRRIRRQILKDMNWDDLRLRCSLFDRFVSGIEWLYYPQLFGLLTNLLHMEGGQKIFLAGLRSRKEYSSSIEKWNKTINILVQRDYQPQSFERFSPDSENETGCKNLVLAARLNRGDIEIQNPLEFRKIEEIRQEMSVEFQKILAEDSRNVYLFKSPTGSGKTEMILGTPNALIVVPTHKLKKEIFERCRSAGFDVMMTPEISKCLPEEDRLRIEYFYKVGANVKVKKFLRSLASGNPKIQDYIEQMEEVENSSDSTSVITTHERFMNLRKLKDVIIIDEDPFRTLLKCGKVQRVDVVEFLRLAAGDDAYNPNMIEKIQKLVSAAVEKDVYSLPKFPLPDIDRLEDAVVKSSVKSNVLGFLHCHNFSLVGDDFHYVTRRYLPVDKKIVILSATASSKVYKDLVGDRLKVLDFGQAELVGKIEQYPQWSFSKRCMKTNAVAVGVAKKILGTTPVITSKEMKKIFPLESVVATFGGLVGLDHMKGQDLGICGTHHLHPVAYMLFANAMGYTVSVSDSTLRMVAVERNGYKFYFNTFPDHDGLREIQLSLIESELFQAVGRARLVNDDAKVTVFSNFPIPGAIFRYVKNGEV